MQHSYNNCIRILKLLFIYWTLCFYHKIPYKINWISYRFRFNKLMCGVYKLSHLGKSKYYYRVFPTHCSKRWSYEDNSARYLSAATLGINPYSRLRSYFSGFHPNFPHRISENYTKMQFMDALLHFEWYWIQ